MTSRWVDVVFTLRPGAVATLPAPFVVAARTVLLAPGASPDVAILGYGLGAMGGLLSKLRPTARIVGVELSKKLHRKSRRHAPRNVELVQSDALRYLRRCRRRFDLVVDDCFVVGDDGPYRPSELLSHAELVASRMNPKGVAVRNLLPDAGQLEHQSEDLRAAFRYVHLRRFRDWDNVLVIASQEPLPARWRRLLRIS